MRETAVVQRIRALVESGVHDTSIIQGIGDDCAVLRPRSNEDFVFTSDFVLEGRHFTLARHKPAEIGHQALARGLSDLAAMGSEPVFFLVSLGVPARLGMSWVDRFYKGLLSLAAKYSVMLAGGDLAQFGKVVADVMCCGRVPRGKAILRSGAKLGDGIYVTGALGGAAHRFALHKRSGGPEPRIRAGVGLRRLGVSAGMDLSDGLSLDLKRLCLESRVSAELDSDLPIAPGASLEHALHGGEDYELLVTMPPKKKVPKKIAGLPLTRIGRIVEGDAGQIHFRGRQLKAKGFDHFR
ncbi:MAG: thiamine-phosphate kinase [Bryobacteraceae bacterium]